MLPLILIALGIFAFLVVFAMLARYLRLWLQSYASSAGIGLFDLVAMSFKKVSPTVIVRSKIMAVQAGLGDSTGITKQALEAHYLAGGRVPLVVQALIAANKAKIKELDWKLATAIDLAGRDVREAVQTSVYPKVIDCPGKNSGRETLDAVAKEQEMIASIEESRAALVEAESAVPKAVAESLTSGQLGIFDYYKLRNLQADTDMRRTIATGTTPGTASVQ